MAKTLKEVSRVLYTGEPTHDNIKTGCMQRIADSCELMAKDRIKMEADLQYYKQQYQNQNGRIDDLNHQISIKKGLITKLKNQIKKLQSC